MRLKQSRVRQCGLRQAVPKKDKEGSSYVAYAAAVPFLAEMWAAGGKLQAEIYGIRLPAIRNLRLQGAYTEVSTPGGIFGYQVKEGPFLTVNDGICLCVPLDSEPDYRIVAIYPHRFLTLEVEKI